MFRKKSLVFEGCAAKLSRVVSRFCVWEAGYLVAREGVSGGWPATWFVFAAYALVVAVTFALVFRYRHRPEQLGTVNP